jgi:hypothetical protein
VVESALRSALGTPVTLALIAHGAGTSSAPPPAPAADEGADIDLDDLVDAPPQAASTPFERLANAFPGSELIDDPDR